MGTMKRTTTVTTTEHTPVLQARGISKVYGTKGSDLLYPALEHIDLTVAHGEFVAIMGPSGSGKTTLLNILATIDAPTAGSVHIDGQETHALTGEALARFRRSSLGFVFQDFNLLDSLTLRENILLPLVLDRVGRREMNTRLAELASMLGIADILDKRTYETSGGQKQRAAIARALITRPSIVLADEPTGNLDSRNSADLMNIFTTMNQELNASILMVTHDPFAASFCQRVLFLQDGRIRSELRRGDNRQKFLDNILDALSAMRSAQ